MEQAELGELGRASLPAAAAQPALIEALRRFSTADWIVAGTALFIVGNAISVCIGWWLHVPILVQVLADAPTHFNTALIFILLGAGELGLVLRRRRVVVATAGVAICLVSAELVEYALGENLGIDTLFAVPFVGLDASHPGQMSGNTIACFLLVCAAQILASKPDRNAGAATTTAVALKTLAGGIAFLAMLGYVVGLKSAYGWTESVGMSLRSYVGFLLIFVARIAALWQRDIVDKPSLPSWFLPFLAISGGTIAMGLIWISTSPVARPYMLDPLYAGIARRQSIAMILSVGTLIALGTISVLVARRKAVMARASENKLSTVLEHMSEGVMLMDAKGEVLYQNAASSRIHGFDPNGTGFIKSKDLPIRWKAWDEAHAPAVLPTVLSKWRDAIALELPFELECPSRAADGTFRNFLTRVQPMKDSEGRLVQWFATTTDVDQLKRIEQSLQVTQARLESTLEAGSVGTWTWDIASDLLVADEFTARMFSVAVGAAAEGLPAEAYMRVIHEEDRADVAEALETAIQLCGAYDIEYRVRQSAGAFRWLQARGRVDSDGAGQATKFHGAVIDITDRKLSELSLRDNNRHLARSNRDLEEFAYVASHDLKSPLSGIDSAAKWLEEDLQGSLSDESRKMLGLMRNRINRMEKLLDDLLTYSRAGRTDTAIVATDVAAIFGRIVGVLGPPAHINVRAEGELPTIVTAAAQLEHVLRNLINNAIKHHDKQNGEVVLSGKRVGDFVEFVVRDDGPGIPPQFHDKIFQLFQTLKRRDEVEGSGMGLALVKKLVEQQNSRVTVHSQGNGTGTEFRFQWPTLPLDADFEEMADA